jgi:hypothetical protein
MTYSAANDLALSPLTRPEISVNDVLFDVETVPLEAVLHGAKGEIRVKVLGKKALLHATSRAVLGVVSHGYRVVPNREALDLGFKACERAFPGISPAEWEATRVAAPRSLSYASIDLNHRTHVLNLLGLGVMDDDPYTPFLRVTNSFNGSRALRFDFGFMREHCRNGVVFEKDVATVKVAHGAREFARLDVQAATINLAGKWEQFTGFVSKVRALSVTVEDSERLIDTLLRVTKCDPESPGWRKDEEGILRQDIRGRLAGYREELGGNAYAVFNVVTDLAARPPRLRIFNKERSTLEERAGRWLRRITADAAKPEFDWITHIAGLADGVISAPRAIPGRS